MKLTTKERTYLITLLGYEIDHYSQEVDRAKEDLSYRKETEYLKECKKSLKFYEKCVKDAKSLQDKLKKE